MTIDTNHFKELLEKEKSLLENELSTIGRKNPDNPKDWEAVVPEDGEPAEEGDVAEEIEEYQSNNAILDQLEIKLNEVIVALSKIESDKYGICETCGETIEEDRLEANPSAATCKKHMNG